jgi:hypothetical protein
MGLDTKTDWLHDRQSQCDFDFDLSSVQFSVGDSHGKFVEDLWRLKVWLEDFMCYNYSNVESVRTNCSYD